MGGALGAGRGPEAGQGSGGTGRLGRSSEAQYPRVLAFAPV